MLKSSINTDIACHHCGEACNDSISIEDKSFCCQGCKMVYQILNENGLENYYRLNASPGVNQKSKADNSYEFLDNEDIIENLINVREDDLLGIQLHLPQIHCSSCLWLLENLGKINAGVQNVRVNFSSKKAMIFFDQKEVSLRQLVQLLNRIGYEPSLNLSDLKKNKTGESSKKIYYQIGLSGFVFGNIMLLSFPEYFGFYNDNSNNYFAFINLALAIPVLLFAASDYLKSAYHGLRYGNFNIDVPISIGIMALFIRSAYEIISMTGEGYLDSFSGFIFFLLIGKWFQRKSYDVLDFDRNFQSYFPISIRTKEEEKWVDKSVDQVHKGDLINIRHGEIIPVDAQIVNGIGKIDYSFVTGESNINICKKGQKLYAGGKQKGKSIELKVLKPVDQSYLTQLWNDEAFSKSKETYLNTILDIISKYFTWVIVSISLITLTYWQLVDPSKSMQAFTAVLIVACPCALALSRPFIYGNVLRILSKLGFHLKNIETIEAIQDIDHIVFDKTGTLTNSSNIILKYEGADLSEEQKSLIKSISENSTHPLSRAICQNLAQYPSYEMDEYREILGSGLIGQLGNNKIKIGSEAFIFGTNQEEENLGVFIEINGEYKGRFEYHLSPRQNTEYILNQLNKNHSLSILSGDSEEKVDEFCQNFDVFELKKYDQKPIDKLNFIKNLQSDDAKLMMIGDGLNDSGALKQSQVGIAISENTNAFSPACDGILEANSFYQLSDFIDFIHKSKTILYGSFALALIYNVVGLYFATTGQLSPIYAAILMPISSVSIIFYGVGVSSLLKKISFPK